MSFHKHLQSRIPIVLAVMKAEMISPLHYLQIHEYHGYIAFLVVLSCYPGTVQSDSPIILGGLTFRT